MNCGLTGTVIKEQMPLFKFPLFSGDLIICTISRTTFQSYFRKGRVVIDVRRHIVIKFPLNLENKFKTMKKLLKTGKGWHLHLYQSCCICTLSIHTLNDCFCNEGCDWKLISSEEWESTNPLSSLISLFPVQP